MVSNRPVLRSFVWLWCLFGVALTACPRPPASRGAQSRKESVRRIPAADDALNNARTQLRAGQTKVALESFLAVRKAYPDSTAGQEALYEAGVIYFESKDYVNARRSLHELLYENPNFEKQADAKNKLAFASLEAGAYHDAFNSLTALASQAQGEEKAKLTDAAREAAERGQLYGELLRIALDEITNAPDEAARRTAMQNLTEIVEGQAPFAEVARAAEATDPSHPGWPVLTFKLARIYYHLRDWPRLTDTLERFIAQAPSSPFTGQARDLLARANRRATVSAKSIGVILPMTGKYKPLGEAVMRGLTLALAGSSVELVVKDSQGDVTLAGKAVEELAFDDQVIGIVGPLLGDDAQRAALVAEELQVPILTLSRQDGITDIGTYVFRNMLTNQAQADALADYATQSMNFSKFAVLYPNIPYGVELSNNFWDAVVSRGGEVRGAETYDYDQTTFTAEAKKLVGRYYLEDRTDYLDAVRESAKDAKDKDAFRRRKQMEKVRSNVEPVVDFEALFIPDDWRKVGLVAPALAVEDIITNACDPRDLERIRKTTGKKDLKTVTLLGANGWSSPKNRDGIPELVSRGGKFVLCSVYVDGFYSESARPQTRKFVSRYRDTYKNQGEPGLLEAAGYDSGGLIRDIVERNGPRTREEFRERLALTKNYKGAMGPTTFSDKREALKPLFFLTIGPDGVKELDPPKPREGS